MVTLKQDVERGFPSASFPFHVFKEEIRGSLMQERLMAMLTGFLGLLVAMLASVGLYGVMSFVVSQRANEIGIRMALGAQRADILALVLREAAQLLVLGLVIGLSISLYATRTTRAMPNGLEPHDPTTLALAAGLLARSATTFPHAAPVVWIP